MGLAAKIDTVFGHDKREQLKSIDSALKLQDYKAHYLSDFEAVFLKVRHDHIYLKFFVLTVKPPLVYTNSFSYAISTR